jgi:hypothetical protein
VLSNNIKMRKFLLIFAILIIVQALSTEVASKTKVEGNGCKGYDMDVAMVEDGTEKVIAVEDGTEKVIAVEDGTEKVIAVEDGTEKVIAVEDGTEKVIAVEDGTEEEDAEESGENVKPKAKNYLFILYKIIN